MTEASQTTDCSRYETAACNFCGNATSTVVYNHGDTAIVRCSRCGLAYASPRLREEIMLQIYSAPSYYTDLYQITDDFLNQRRSLHDLMVEAVVKRIGPPVVNGRLLDVGCGVGIFMQYARRAGWQVEGWEASPFAAQIARERFGLNVHTGIMDFDQVAPQSCEVVALLDVIEHVYDPMATLRNVHRILSPGGRLALTTGNFVGLSVRLFGGREYGLDTSENGFGHVTFFTQRTLRAFLKSAGFDHARFWFGELCLKNFTIWLGRRLCPGRSSHDLHRHVRQVLRPSWWTLALYHMANWLLGVTRLGDEMTVVAYKR